MFCLAFNGRCRLEPRLDWLVGADPHGCGSDRDMAEPPTVFPTAVDQQLDVEGVLCERIWLLRGRDPTLAHHAPVLRALIFAAFGGTVALIIGLVAVNLPLTLTGVAVAVLSKLWMLDRMVWIYAEKGSDTAASDAR